MGPLGLQCPEVRTSDLGIRELYRFMSVLWAPDYTSEELTSIRVLS